MPYQPSNYNNSENENIELLDILTIISFALQVKNQSKIFGINDVQKELHNIVTEIHQHLEKQDDKIDRIMELLKND